MTLWPTWSRTRNEQTMGANVQVDQETSRPDWALLLIANEALGVEGPETLDPVRIQKGMFLLSMRGPRGAGDLYRFRPYNWGPFSSDLYGDLDFLVATGALTREHVSGRTWDRFRANGTGDIKSQEVG